MIDDTVGIAIASYPEVWRASVHGLTDMFMVAERYDRLQSASEPRRLRVSHYALDDAGSVLKVFDTHPSERERVPAAVVLPPAIGDELPFGERMGGFPEWIRTHHQSGAIICSACGGVSLLAQTGLLAGRSATTHWLHGEAIAKRHPDVRIDTDKMLLDEGDIITAGGMMAWTDLGLRLIDRLLGANIMLATARFMLIDPGAREQSFYSTFTPRLDHEDMVILDIQHWLHGTDTKGLGVPAMAERARLGERTFLRRFQKATGLNPTEYAQRLRVAKARDLLAQSSLSTEQVAWASGYEDANAFRKIFRKIVGVSPGEYRMRFSIVTPPAERDGDVTG
ncbi:MULTISPECIES: GlxA family transcriptional regulator [Alphaproteobacteria]|uniref:AraC family transcriptional regulator n=2 Tax=Alphaproteobacteria TaxID=28211 RepID=A0A512HL43_9HYPH|nr:MULTISPECIES: helix-turn-helix domain-containing protein [Alphaproteobacteria]GEO86161.1 AraC family transcriptional regulator [Ciceribacter naphthalenivorans]GLR22728.1 AraC family transcriptional regulator [Ciceribacter naphthalenivorans]GLT05584.1 AraC family transcriptional regulator [Sphingomonas psychrolutea]